jgi:hypothetical protein
LLIVRAPGHVPVIGGSIMGPSVAIPLALVAAAIAVVTTLRELRANGAICTRTGACDACGRDGPVETVAYRQNTGKLYARESRIVTGRLCRRCSTRAFLRTTGHTAVLGWWGALSLVVTPIFILNNLGYFLWTQTLPGAEALRAHALDGQRAHALALLVTQERGTVIDVISRATGAPPDEVASWLATLR